MGDAQTGQPYVFVFADDDVGDESTLISHTFLSRAGSIQLNWVRKSPSLDFVGSRRRRRGRDRAEIAPDLHHQSANWERKKWPIHEE